jgi:pyridoxamine 5'-phosphate oxidase
MIKISELSREKPYQSLEKYYDMALKNLQENIDVISISSFNKGEDEVDSRLVNLKYIINDEWIFFTNYNSKKSTDFQSHDQISALLFWNSINLQVRMKARVTKTSINFNDIYFKRRDTKKNALAISSYQSQKISSYEEVVRNYEETIIKSNTKECPEYWGGYSFTPYYFEFWEGHESRINKREVFEKTDGIWKNSFLQP